MRNINFMSEKCVGLTNETQLFKSNLTEHAIQRMSQRGIKANDIELVMDYGKEIYAKGVIYYVLGKKEVKRYSKQVPRLKQLEGIRVITSTHNCDIITVYRNCESRIPNI